MKKIAKRGIVAILLVPLIAGLAGCAEWTAFKEKVKSTEVDDQSVYFALAGPTEALKAMGFQDGMNLALSEINASGILGGKSLVIEEYDDQEDLTLGVRAAQEIVAVEKYSGVIGHSTSNICLSTKNIYNDGGVLVMSPLVSNVKLTDPPLPYIFQSIPSDREEMGKILEYARGQGYKKLVVLYRDNEYGRGLSNLINQKSREYEITVVDSHSDFVNQNQFDAQYEKWMALGVDAVFIGDSMPEAKEFITSLRKKNQTIPILGCSGLNFSDITAELDSNYATGITYLDPYHADRKSANYQAFQGAFVQAYGKEPGYLSLIAYDTVKLLAEATEVAGTADAVKIAGVLKDTERWNTTLGSFHFDESGNAVGMDLALVKVNNGIYTYQ